MLSTETKILRTESEIRQLITCLPYADGQNYYRDNKRINELRERLFQLNAQLIKEERSAA